MPELPEVEAFRKLAELALIGRRSTRVSTVDDSLVFDGTRPRAVSQSLKGRRVDRACRKGKFLWFELGRGPCPVFHFGMTGFYAAYSPWADRPPFWKCELAAHAEVHRAFANTRRLDRIRLLEQPLQQPPLASLGFGALRELPSAGELERRLAKRPAPIQAVLLDQHFAAGPGNRLAAEILYQSGIAPHRPALSLGSEEVRRLRRTWKRVVGRTPARSIPRMRLLFPSRDGSIT